MNSSSLMIDAVHGLKKRCLAFKGGRHGPDADGVLRQEYRAQQRALRIVALHRAPRVRRVTVCAAMRAGIVRADIHARGAAAIDVYKRQVFEKAVIGQSFSGWRRTYGKTRVDAVAQKQIEYAQLRIDAQMIACEARRAKRERAHKGGDFVFVLKRMMRKTQIPHILPVGAVSIFSARPVAAQLIEPARRQKLARQQDVYKRQGLEDPTGKPDADFIAVIRAIERRILEWKAKLE